MSTTPSHGITPAVATRLLEDPQVFGSVLAGPSWAAWRVFLKALHGAPLDPDELLTFQRCTGRTAAPTVPTSEAWLICGRRSGKSYIAAVEAVKRACFYKYRLAPGERGVVMVIAGDRRQARVVLRYIVALLRGSPMLAPLIANETSESVELTNGITIEIATASFRSIRGYTIVAAICDETGFWRSDDAANPDTEILAALRPAMATVPDALLLCLSSPYARRGELYRAHRDHFGQNGDPVLVWQADTRTMNPTVPQDVIDRAYDEDAVRALAEYGAQFRSDREEFVGLDVIERCTPPGRTELAPMARASYVAFVDPSGGSSDSMTLAIAHPEGERVVLDRVIEVPAPFDPDAVVQTFAQVCRTFRITGVVGDHYGGEWPAERFRAHGLSYRRADKAKSDLYLAALPLLTSGRADLLDLPRLRQQLTRLERRTGSSGREIVDHAPRDHDDVANAVAGALVTALGSRTPVIAAVHVRPGAWHARAGASLAVQQMRAQKSAALAQQMAGPPKE